MAAEVPSHVPQDNAAATDTILNAHSYAIAEPLMSARTHIKPLYNYMICRANENNKPYLISE